MTMFFGEMPIIAFVLPPVIAGLFILSRFMSVWFVGALLLGFLYACGQASPSPSCMTKGEAREAFPRDHIYRHDGCWYSKRSKYRVAPDAKNVMADASGNTATDAVDAVTIPLDAFVGPHEPLPTYMVPELMPLKKADKLDVLLQEEAAKIEPPKPIKTETIVPPKPFPQWERMIVAWFLVIASALAGCGFSALAIHLWRQHRSDPNVNVDTYSRIPTARLHHQLKGSGERPLTRSAGEGDQQPYLHTWNIHDRWWGIDERGRRSDSCAPQHRSDDSSALGAWSRSRGFRPEASPATASEVDSGELGLPRKRNSWWERLRAVAS